MIRYALICDEGHSYESWFATSSSFDMQAKRRLVSCPVCGSTRVEKQIMAPAVQGARKETEVASQETNVPETSAVEPAPDESQSALSTEPSRKLRALVHALHEEVKTKTEDVGNRFALEARKIHYGDAQERGIRGTTTPQESAALSDEGISVHALPALPDDLN
jgi:hypothetical protein